MCIYLIENKTFQKFMFEAEVEYRAIILHHIWIQSLLLQQGAHDSVLVDTWHCRDADRYIHDGNQIIDHVCSEDDDVLRQLGIGLATSKRTCCSVTELFDCHKNSGPENHRLFTSRGRDTDRDARSVGFTSVLTWYHWWGSDKFLILWTLLATKT